MIWLTSIRYEQREIRQLQVLKLRGSGFPSGRHSYRLSADGMSVFPRLADQAEQVEYKFETRHVSSGVKSLDSVLGRGYRAGSSTLVIGPSGAGKTVLGLHFALEGAREGDTTVFATFDENPSQIAAAAASFGWSFDVPEIHLVYRSAVDLHLDEWVYELLELVESGDVRRVFIDGLANLRAAAQDPTRFQEYLYSLVQRFARNAVTFMMSLESAELFAPSRLTDVPLSQIADNVLVLQFVHRDGEYRRALTVLKSRGAKTEPHLSEYTMPSRERHWWLATSPNKSGRGNGWPMCCRCWTTPRTRSSRWIRSDASLHGTRALSGCTAGAPMRCWGRHPPSFLHLDLGDERLAEVRRELDRLGRWRGEASVERKDGSFVWIDALTVAVRGRDGTITGYLGIHRDITERKRQSRRCGRRASVPRASSRASATPFLPRIATGATPT